MKEGIVSVLKPPGMSSSDVVGDIRRLFQEKRVGHLGTLDPGAAGVLPVCVGRAVRLFDYLVDKEKTYRFELLFGRETDTQDVYGRVTDRTEKNLSRQELEGLLPRFRGEIIQQAPAYSALKSGGKKLYDLALAGKVGLVRNPAQVAPLMELGVYHKVIVASATEPVAVLEAALAANDGKEYDLSISCVNTPNCEMSAILPVRDGGIVYFFSMATSFTKAALGAEGIGKDVTMIVGNGYTKDHADITLNVLRENEKIRKLFDEKYV